MPNLMTILLWTTQISFYCPKRVFSTFFRQIDKKLDEVFSKGKPHIKKAAPEAKGEQIKGEQQGEYECVIR